MEEPPLRIVSVNDAYAAAEKNDFAKVDLDREWKAPSCSTVYLIVGEDGGISRI